MAAPLNDFDENTTSDADSLGSKAAVLGVKSIAERDLRWRPFSEGPVDSRNVERAPTGGRGSAILTAETCTEPPLGVNLIALDITLRMT